MRLMVGGAGSQLETDGSPAATFLDLARSPVSSRLRSALRRAAQLGRSVLHASPSPRLAGAPAFAGRANRVACVIVAFNEADRIERAIRSVAGLVDETLVVDSGSTDETAALCERLGARVVHHPWGGFGPQKRFAEDAARCDWILSLDADEWLSDALRDELAALFAAPLPPTRCFRVHVRVVYPRRDAPAPFAHSHKYVRLYNRTTARFRDSLTHDVVEATADVAWLEGDILHKSYRDFAHIVTKTIGYYELQREEGIAPSRVGLLRMAFEFPFQFFKYYILRRHLFGGADGFAYATALAMGRWARIFILRGW
jgi:glycosyltransferase involved in cell wall biosynthesis